jgi:hypothetical protein
MADPELPPEEPAALSLTNLRAFGHLPAADSLADDYLTPHFDAAKRKVKRMLPDVYDDLLEADDPDLIEAIFSQSMAMLLPSMHTLYSNGITDYNENGTSTRWMSPAEVDAAVTRYNNRVAEVVSVLTTETEMPGNFRYYDLSEG